MDLILLVLVVVLIGFVVWMLTTKVPMPPGWATAIQILALVVILLYVLSRFVNLPNVLPRCPLDTLPPVRPAVGGASHSADGGRLHAAGLPVRPECLFCARGCPRNDDRAHPW